MQGNISLCFVDLRKAYDTVPRALLWETMETFGLGGKFLNLIKALYANDNIRIVVNGIESDPIYPERGLKQGCPLSPMLFAIYLVNLTNDLNEKKEGIWIGGTIISALFFADDCVIGVFVDGHIPQARASFGAVTHDGHSCVCGTS